MDSPMRPSPDSQQGSCSRRARIYAELETLQSDALARQDAGVPRSRLEVRESRFSGMKSPDNLATGLVGIGYAGWPIPEYAQTTLGGRDGEAIESSEDPRSIQLALSVDEAVAGAPRSLRGRDPGALRISSLRDASPKARFATQGHQSLPRRHLHAPGHLWRATKGWEEKGSPTCGPGRPSRSSFPARHG